MSIAQNKEVVLLKNHLQEANERLEGEIINIENSGSFAEAFLQLNGVFSAAQNAAENIWKI